MDASSHTSCWSNENGSAWVLISVCSHALLTSGFSSQHEITSSPPTTMYTYHHYDFPTSQPPHHTHTKQTSRFANSDHRRCGHKNKNSSLSIPQQPSSIALTHTLTHKRGLSVPQPSSIVDSQYNNSVVVIISIIIIIVVVSKGSK